MNHGPELTPKQHKDLQWLKRNKLQRAPFYNGWMAAVSSLLFIAAIVFAGNIHFGESPLPASNWWWFVGMCALAFGGRSYQYFTQKR